MDQLLEKSKAIVGQAITDYQPYAIVMMFSGGDDSLTAYHVVKALEIPVTHMLHGVTGTGIPETTDFARSIGGQSGLNYIEANAGDAYEKYILRKGFFGIGIGAHSMAYHVLKHQRFTTALSTHIRHRKHNRNILLLNGARWQESRNRKHQMKYQPIKHDSNVASNIWVNIINDWSKLDCRNFLEGKERNPVVDLLHRSAECLCGSTQSLETRKEVEFWYPEWGKWLRGLEKRACERGFCWGWGEDLPPDVKAQKARAKEIANGQLEMDLPMCQSCEYLSMESDR